MTIAYKNYLTSGITGNTTVYNPTTANIQATVIGMIICNNTSNVAVANVSMYSGATRANIVSQLLIPSGTSLNVIDSSRLIVAANNTVTVSSSQSVDVTISAIEVT